MKRIAYRLLDSWRGLPRAVWVVMAVYAVGMVAVSLAQYHWFIYSGYDLGIFDQVVWNTSQGRLFEYSFNSYSYLVDHREWLLLPLSVLYWVAPHALTLLVVQTVVLVSGVVPLVLIAQKVLGASGRRGALVLVFVAVAYVLNPSVQAMNLFEFHVLPFVLPLSLWLWWLLLQHRWRWVWVVFVVLLLVREDVALMTAGLGLLLVVFPSVIMTARARVAGAVMTVASLMWFGLMVWVGTFFSPEGSSKFFTFYDWAGGSPLEGVSYILMHPLQTVGVLFGYDHLIVVLFLFVGVGLLPVLRLRLLLPAAGPLLLYLLIDQQMLSSVINSHYAAVVLPWFFIAGVEGYARLAKKRVVGAAALGGVVFTIIVAQWLSIGPQWTVIHRFALQQHRDLNVYSMYSGDSVAETGQSVMLSERLYTRSAHRQALYPTLHVFTGKQHFSAADYKPPDRVDAVVLEQESVLRYGINLPFTDRSQAHERLRLILDQNGLVATAANEELVAFYPAAERGGQTVPLVSPGVVLAFAEDISVNGDLRLLSWEHTLEGELRLHFRKEEGSVLDDDQHLQVIWRDENGRLIKEKLFALGYGLYPTHSWEQGSEHVVHVYLRHPLTAASVELRFGPLIKQFGPLFTLWRADPVLDGMRTVSVDLPGVAPLDATVKAFAGE